MSSIWSHSAESFIATHVSSIRTDFAGNDESSILHDTNHLAESAMNDFIMSISAETQVDNEVLRRKSVLVYDEVLYDEREIAIINLEKLISLRKKAFSKLKVQLRSKMEQNRRLKLAVEESRTEHDKLNDSSILRTATYRGKI